MTKKLICAFLCILLTAMTASRSQAEQTAAEIEADDPYMTEAVS